MEEALLIKLKDALKKADLSEELAKDIDITNESEIEAKVKELKEKSSKIKLTGDELLKAISEAGLKESFDKHLQSEVDRRVTQAVKTHDEKLEKERKDKEDEEKKKKEREGMNEQEKTIAELKDTVANQGKIIEELTGKFSNTNLDTLKKDALKKAGLPEGFIKYVNVDDPEKIGDVVEELKNQVQEHQQKEIDEKIEKGEIPKIGEPLGSVKEDTAKDIADERNKSTQEIPSDGKNLGLVPETKK